MADAERSETREFLELLRAGGRFVLTTHVHPDADGIGSELALAHLVRACGAEARVVNRDPVPGVLAFLDGDGLIEVYDAPRHDAVIAAAEGLICLDNSEPGRLAEMEGPVRGARGRKVAIDHHPEPDASWDILIVREDASSTAEVVMELLRAARVPLGPEVARVLYAGLVSDTGRFRFANTSAGAFRMAADLVAAGASPPLLHGKLEERLSAPFLRLMGRMLCEADLRVDGRLIVLRVPPVAHPGQLEWDDMSEVINEALRLDGSRLAVLFREIEGGRTKVSLRSKGPLDVNRLARQHGGGGHRNASGLVLRESIDAAAARLLPELERLART
ncbi:MAG: bifunctional oligoribonuclease/PAP phosphatase NrnA [Acidobacteria bacterium]|nr:bifunctional oligoribonuclease/PAP phosphatase NrnA [Acidobacteriota bacterium]